MQRRAPSGSVGRRARGAPVRVALSNRRWRTRGARADEPSDVPRSAALGEEPSDARPRRSAALDDEPSDGGARRDEPSDGMLFDEVLALLDAPGDEEPGDDEWIDVAAPIDEEPGDERWSDEEPADERWGDEELDESRWSKEAPRGDQWRDETPRDGDASTPVARSQGTAATAGWRELLDQAARDAAAHTERAGERLDLAGAELLYVIDPQRSRARGCVALDTMMRRPKKDGAWGRAQLAPLSSSLARQLDDDDRRIVGLLTESRTESPTGWGGARIAWAADGWDSRGTSQFELGAEIGRALLPAMCATGRCFVRELKARDDEPLEGAAREPSGRPRKGRNGKRGTPNERPAAVELHAVRWDGGPPWQLRLKVTSQGDLYVVSGLLVRDGETMALDRPALLTNSGFVVTRESVAALLCRSFRWIVILRSVGEVRLPRSAKNSLMRALYSGPDELVLECPAELRLEETRPPLRPALLLRKPRRSRYAPAGVVGELHFDYDGLAVEGRGEPARILVPSDNRLVARDLAGEERARKRLHALGFGPSYDYYDTDAGLELRNVRRMPDIVATLVSEGWLVRAEGQLCRAPSRLAVSVRSGIDWFGLEGAADFEGICLPLPRLLAAIRKGSRTVQLGDGSVGVLPAEWLGKYGRLAALAGSPEEPVRFALSQATLLDALLAELPDVELDEAFARARERMARFEGVEPLDAPASFVGALRSYQRDGLGWLAFLREMGFGGCLADDMGLGKTIQVLAALDARRLEPSSEGAAKLPSLVVVPRSLLDNWASEASRFVPELRVMRHDGAGRGRDATSFEGFDLVLCTYGTLRSDAAWLSRAAFDYVVLDEAQTIKNARTNVAKAARLLRGQHRLALSGTPIENHLGELWSLFEFLNPGMLGTSAFGKLLEADTRNPSPEVRQLLSRALRPFILRRTKREVAPELPARLEQTLYCNLEGRQRALYEELRDHYRASVLGRVEEVGIGRAKMHVLEALLRLRQAACHPALIDEKHRSLAAAKLELLLPMLDEVTRGGHKALVFSQFTNMLALVRERLDEARIRYEYLDGRTRDRAARVERFQQSSDCSLFLISLKAGGLGLNLTAADYVFLLDPWWNPAVEAQAIDRTHRIGQTAQVFAYRIIARGTIEEKVLELQARKRGLADDIIRADAGLLRKLEREDLELLLG